MPEVRKNKSAEMFMLESGFDVEDMFVDILYWFSNILGLIKAQKEMSCLKSFVLSVIRNTVKS